MIWQKVPSSPVTRNRFNKVKSLSPGYPFYSIVFTPFSSFAFALPGYWIMQMIIIIIIIIIIIFFINLRKNRLHNAVYKISKDVCHNL